MRIQRSGVVLAVVAATALVGVGAQAASRTAASLTPPPSSSSPNPSTSTTSNPSQDPTPTSQPAVQEQTPMPSETPQNQTDWEQQVKLAIKETQKFGATLVGMNVDEAEKMAQNSGFIVRVIERDGESFMITMDYRTNRVDVKVTNDIITDFSVG